MLYPLSYGGFGLLYSRMRQDFMETSMTTVEWVRMFGLNAPRRRCRRLWNQALKTKRHRDAKTHTTFASRCQCQEALVLSHTGADR